MGERSLRQSASHEGNFVAAHPAEAFVYSDKASCVDDDSDIKER